MRYLIANANDVKSIGVKMRLEVLVNLIKKADKDSEIIVHSTNKKVRKTQRNIKIQRSLYLYLLVESRNPLDLLIRSIKFCAVSIIFKLGIVRSMKKLKDIESVKILADYMDSDVIVFIGGNWLKTESSFKSKIELFYKLMIIGIGKYYSKKVVVMPLTFGPFSNQIYSKLSTHVLKLADKVLVRDKLSYRLLKESLGKKLILSNDIILFHKNTYQRNIKSDFISKKAKLNIVISMMNWKNSNDSKAIAEALNNISSKYKLRVTPLFLDSAGNTTEKRNFKSMTEQLKNNNKYYKNFHYTASYIAQSFDRADLVISTRTNSTLLSIVYEKPFIAISKYQKVRNLLKLLCLERLFIDEIKLDSVGLIDKITYVIENYHEIKNEIRERHISIIEKDSKMLFKLFTNIV